METALLFLVIFGVFFWALRGLLRFTQNTVGENSPRKVERVYKTTHRSYWLTFDAIFATFFILMGGCFAYAGCTTSFRSAYPLWTAYAVIFLLVIQFLALGLLVMSLIYSYWRGIGPVTLRYSPRPFTLVVNTRTRVIELRDDTIAHVTKVLGKSRGFAAGTGYYVFEFYTGDLLFLSTYTKGLWAFFDYFPDIPTTYEYRYFPILLKRAAYIDNQTTT
jgi:hypothetical protein